MKKMRLFVYTAREIPETSYTFNPWDRLAAVFESDVFFAEIPAGCSDWEKLLRVSVRSLVLISRMCAHDVVISTSVVNGFFFALLQRMLGKRIIRPRHIMIDVGSMRRFSGAGRAVRSVISWFFAPLDSIVCYASSSIDFWQRTIGVGVECFFVPLPAAGPLVPGGSVSPAAEGYVFSAGRYGRDYPLLLDAIEGMDVPLVIVADNTTYSSLQARVGHNPLIRIYREILYSRYAELLRAARFVVLPLLPVAYHTGQTVLMQAMALGKAVIATRSSGTVDYVADNEDGVLVEPGNALELRNKILFLLNNPVELRRIAENARRKASVEFSDEAFGKRMEHIVSRRCIGDSQ